MNTALLATGDRARVEAYVAKKFKTFASWRYSKTTRNKKCVEYYLATAEKNRDVIEYQYQLAFHQMFPTELAEQAEAARERRPKKPAMLESSEWLESRKEQAARTEALLGKLSLWEETQAYQEGEDFFLELQSAVAAIDPTLCDVRQFRAENEMVRVASLTGSGGFSGRVLSGQFDAMIGLKQHAEITFEAYSPDWGQVNAKLEESFKAGAWGSGSAQARMAGMGFSAQAQAAIAIGAQLDISGDCVWKHGKAGLSLGGACSLFAGGKAHASAKITGDARKGLDLAIKAGAFAGFQATASGSCGFTYGDKKLVSLRADAGITFGAGAEFEASLSTSLFGPTEVKFGASLTLGLGVSHSTAAAIDFNGIYLAGAEEFRKVIYLPTILRGYEMTLMTQDRKNLHYLNKCILRMQDDLSDIEESIATFERMSPDKMPLLVRAAKHG